MDGKSRERRILLRTAMWYAPASLIAGVINGLLGAGGGVIMLYLIAAVLKRRGDCSGRDVFASVIAVILPVSLVSAVSYAASGLVDMDEMQILLLPALAGGAVGAYLTDRLPVNVIRGIFAVLVIISGIRMVM